MDPVKREDTLNAVVKHLKNRFTYCFMGDQPGNFKPLVL
jgi:hypothetical protein